LLGTILKTLLSFLSVEIPMMLVKNFWASNKARSSSSFTLKTLGEVALIKSVYWRSLVKEVLRKTSLSEEEAGKIGFVFRGC
jgi:hypothetical protein